MSVTLAVEIQDASPLRGLVRLPDGAWEPFVGWTALAMLVSEAADGVVVPATASEGAVPGSP